MILLAAIADRSKVDGQPPLARPAPKSAHQFLPAALREEDLFSDAPQSYRKSTRHPVSATDGPERLPRSCVGGHQFTRMTERRFWAQAGSLDPSTAGRSLP